MSGQTHLIKSDPREGVKKNLSEISERKGVWPLGEIGGMDSGDLQSGNRQGRETTAVNIFLRRNPQVDKRLRARKTIIITHNARCAILLA